MSSFNFGEIVEPTTRALIDDDVENYPEYTQILPEWEGNCPDPPREIDSLVFFETVKIKKLLISCVLQKEKPVCKLKNGGVEIYKLKGSLYIVTYFEPKEMSTGQIVEAFEKWISVARNIYTVTSNSIHNYQNVSLTQKPSSLIRMLSNDPKEKIQYRRLEPPNLITGLGANVLSYCIHTEMKCTLFIAYIDNAPLDSVNTGILLELFRKLNIPIINSVVKGSEDISSSNLYI